MKGILSYQLSAMTNSTPRVRFAPSPTGYLHKGHAFSALAAFEAAKAGGGRFILRIEDIDATRVRPEYDAAVLEDLNWLGLEQCIHGNIVPDFPLCNKSFNQSYSGHDL